MYRARHESRGRRGTQGSTSANKGTGPSTLLVTLHPGLYSAALTSGFLPLNGGPFTFAGLGGTDVQPFSAGVDVPNPLFWTNQSPAGTIARAQGVVVNWTGNDPDTYVRISGSATTAGPITVFFTCDAPVGPGTFTVPPAVLLALPAAAGGLTFSTYTTPAGFNATGLDFGFATSNTSVFQSITYQ